MKERQTMSNGNNIRGKITNWLLEEGLTHTLNPNEDFDFVIRVSEVYDTLFADISKEKGRERIYFSINLTYQDEQTQKAYSKLSKKDKNDFHFNLRVGLLNFGVEYNIQPATIDEFNSVLIQKPVYLEDMTKSSFMNGFNTFRDALVFLTLFTNKHLSSETSPSQSKAPQPPGMG
jgi:hypothetical protein